MPEGMRVSGTNNRVAGRDYNENNYVSIAKPCQKCEIRFVTEEHTVCNHCTRQEQTEQLKFYLVVILAAVLFVGFELHKWREAHGLLPQGEGLFNSMLLSATLLFFGYFAALWSWIYLKAWWRNK